MADGGLPDEHDLLLVESLRFVAMDDNWHNQLKMRRLANSVVGELMETAFPKCAHVNSSVRRNYFTVHKSVDE